MTVLRRVPEPLLWIFKEVPITHVNASRRVARDLVVVCRKDDSDAQFLVDFGDQLHDTLPVLRVEASRRLVCQEQAGVVHHGACDSDSLHFASGELGRVVIGSCDEPYLPKKTHRILVRLLSIATR